MNQKVLILIIGLVAVVPLVAYASHVSTPDYVEIGFGGVRAYNDGTLAVKSYDTLPSCTVEGSIIYSQNNQNLLVCTSLGWSIPDGTLLE